MKITIPEVTTKKAIINASLIYFDHYAYIKNKELPKEIAQKRSKTYDRMNKMSIKELNAMKDYPWNDVFIIVRIEKDYKLKKIIINNDHHYRAWCNNIGFIMINKKELRECLNVKRISATAKEYTEKVLTNYINEACK